MEMDDLFNEYRYLFNYPDDLPVFHLDEQDSSTSRPQHSTKPTACSNCKKVKMSCDFARPCYVMIYLFLIRSAAFILIKPILVLTPYKRREDDLMAPYQDPTLLNH